jgi:hypothetical protein
MKLVASASVLLALLSGCGGLEPDVHRSSLSEPTLSQPSLRELRVDRFGAQRLTTASRVIGVQGTCTPDAAPTGTSHTLNLWPPNHSLHTISAADCVSIADDCDSDLTAELTWASSDEPENSIGDGNHVPDIVVGCDGVQLRAERQGPRNGRVYHVGWRVEDSAGNVAEGACKVIVDHDQSGAITEDDGELYRVDLDPTACEPEPDPTTPMCPDASNPDCL